MKLIILSNRSDGCTWYATDTIPIEYESEEQLISDMEDWANVDTEDHAYWREGWNNTGISSPMILGTDPYESYSIMTLDDWFTRSTQ